MNTADLCPEGRTLYAEYLKLLSTYREFQRMHMMFAASNTYHRFLHHVDNECAICKQEEE